MVHGSSTLRSLSRTAEETSEEARRSVVVAFGHDHHEENPPLGGVRASRDIGPSLDTTARRERLARFVGATLRVPLRVGALDSSSST
jgi:hypothetical protein